MQGEPQKKYYYEEKGHFIIGGAVDTYLSHGQEVYDTMYFAPENAVKPKSEKIMSIIQYAYDKAIEIYSYDTIKIQSESGEYPFFNSDKWWEIIHHSCDFHEYYMNRKKPTWQVDGRIALVAEDKMLAYVTSLLQGNGKQLLSEEEQLIINADIMSITTHPNTRDYFICQNEFIDIYYQLVIYFEYMDTDCKALLDMVRVNHETKSIYAFDFKTMAAEPFFFLTALKQRDYQIQAAWYMEALNTLVNNPDHPWYGYSLVEFNFIVESTTLVCIGTPLVFTCDITLLEIGFNGIEAGYNFIERDNGSTVDRILYRGTKGINQLMEDLKYYKENGFDKRKEVRENGRFIINYTEILPYNGTIRNINEDNSNTISQE